MGKTLILAEKPSVARDIAKVLNCGQKENGFLMGKKYIVTWALGHLVTLEDPEAYDAKYKTWRLEDLPMLPKKMKLAAIKQTSKQFYVVSRLMHRKDVDDLVIATDSGREGELVARWIIIKSGCRKPIKRLWISSQTNKAIKDGFNNLKPGSNYDNLFKSSQCRAEADWLVGLNVTRALTCKHNAQLSAGRVQTPTLAMIVERENEIKNFKPKDYWTISATSRGYRLNWRGKKGNTRIFDKKYADSIVQKVKGKNGKITEIKKESKREPAPLLYDLTELQRDANRKYGYSAKQTLSIMQRLYEFHKIVTYPRTDSRYITDDIVPTLAERLKSVSVGPYAQFSREIIKSGVKTTKRLVDNTKVTDHHAIIPTEEFVNLGSLSFDERNIFDLIVKRFLAMLSPAFEYEQTTIFADINGETFTARGRVIKSKGWKEIYDGQNDDLNQDNDEQEQSLPDIKKGEAFSPLSVELVSGKTKPPARFTEATLLTAMESPGKYVDDDRLRETLDKSGGLGTPATRADIIEKLFNSFYIEKQGKEIIPTSKGIQLISIVPEELKSAELTAKWEQKLEMISRGKANPDKFVEDMRKYASQLVSKVVASSDVYKHDNLTRERCPDCGKFLLDVKGKRGRMLVCQDRECGFKKTVSIISNARCPQCHKKMEIRGEGQDKSFYCSCGYREKVDSYNKKKEKSVSKKEVNRFMRQQNDHEINTALADALAKWKE